MFRIAHLFADHGVESEALSAYGEVYRYTINPRPNEFVTETVQMDLMAEMPDVTLDLAFLHPSCAPWADTTHIDGDPDEHENQVPRAREIARSIADDYVIENKPRAPLEDPVVLNGRTFGLPLAYERAFETSFPVDEPPRHQTLTEKTVTPYYYSDRTHAWWKAAKGYVGEYPKEHLAKNALPVAYVHFLTRQWLESQDTRDAEEAQDNNSPAPREVPEDQASLLQSDGGVSSTREDTDTDRSGGGE